MSLISLFDIGRSGVNANQKALGVTSNNIANINTPGYSRQDVVMEVAAPLELQGSYIGRGVEGVEIRRSFDQFTYMQILGQSSTYGRSFSLEKGLSYIEQVFNEPQNMGLFNSMQEYFNAWQEVATNPDGAAQRSSLLIKANAFMDTAKQMETDIEKSLSFINDQIGDVVDQVNVLIKNIATANGKVMEIEAGTNETANTFRDEREKLMKDLAKLVEFDWNENSDGTVTIVAGRRSLVAGVKYFELNSALNDAGEMDVYGSDGTNLSDYFTKGELGGYFDLRDEIKDNALAGLRKLVASVIQETNYIHYNNGYDLDGNTNINFFDPLQLYTRDDTTGGSGASITSSSITDSDPSTLTLDEYDIVFTGAAAYEVRNHDSGAVVSSGAYTSGGNIDFNGIRVVITDGTGAPAAGDTFFVSPLQNAVSYSDVSITSGRQIAAAKSASTVPGDNTNALDIVNKYRSDISNLGDKNFEDYYSEIVATVGGLSKAAQDSLEFEDNLLFELENRRESVSGVSLDEEAANLMRYQRAFEAGARIIKVADELLEMVINL